MRRGGNIDRSLSALALAVLALASGFARAAGGDTPGVRVEASFTADDNVTRAAGDDALSDSILGVRVGASAAVPISTHTRALVQGFAGAERFNTYTSLSRNFIGAQGDFKYRASGEFGAATYGGFVRTAAEYYESSLRDGYRHALGVTVLKPATDRVQFFGALTQNIADGNSTVFDAKNLSLRGNADWSLTRWDVVYFGLEYRRGDAVSTARPSLTIVNSVDAIVRDDAFDDAARFAYRFKASAWLASLGYNRAFAERHSLDISWRGVKTTPSDSALSEIGYVVNQFSVAYLARF
jgi:hypothetical protein